MKLHMHKVSTTSRPILLFIAENNIDIEQIVVDLMTGEHLQAPFSNLNPNKLVPVLEDGEFVLTESSSILKYLAEKTGSGAYPSDLQKRAKVNEMMDWFNTQFYREFGYHMVYPQVYPHHVREPEEANKATVEWGRTQAEGTLGVLNDHVLASGNAYLCGNDMTIADYFGAGLLSSGDLIGVNYAKYANVNQWFNKMRSLPSWGAVSDVHDGFAASMKEKTFTTIS